jgi:16S rRNA U516 pseudouridylate synthase RsuA-like enzyme
LCCFMLQYHARITILHPHTPHAAVSQTTLKVIDPKSARFGERVEGVVPRTTVYQVAARAGFPSDLGLAGRLDYLTSGIMLMSNDSRMLQGVIRPPDDDEEEEEGEGGEEARAARRQQLFKYKTKVYEVRCFSDRLFSLADPAEIAAELAAPFSFQRQGQRHRTSPARVRVLRRWQSREHSHGRPELGWSVDLRIELKEGKHHQVMNE